MRPHIYTHMSICCKVSRFQKWRRAGEQRMCSTHWTVADLSSFYASLLLLVRVSVTGVAGGVNDGYRLQVGRRDDSRDSRWNDGGGLSSRCDSCRHRWGSRRRRAVPGVGGASDDHGGCRPSVRWGPSCREWTRPAANHAADVVHSVRRPGAKYGSGALPAKKERRHPIRKPLLSKPSQFKTRQPHEMAALKGSLSWVDNCLVAQSG